MQSPSAVNGVERASVLHAYQCHPMAVFETYKAFNQHGEGVLSSRSAFNEAALQGVAVAPPSYRYPNIDRDETLRWRSGLLELAGQASELDMEVEANRLLRENITQRLHEASIMLLSKSQSEMQPGQPGYESISAQLGWNMREVYGTPERDHWLGILGYRLYKLSFIEEHTNVPGSVREAWDYVKSNIPSGLPIQKPYKPQAETVQWYRGRLMERLAPAIHAVGEAMMHGEVSLDAEDRLTANGIVQATRIALHARGAKGWDAALTDEANIDTTQADEAIYVPRGRTMTVEQFNAVMQSHEIDIHVMRRVNGDASAEPMLGGVGCSGYLGWDEGHGKANESLLKGAVNLEQSAFAFYLSTGLALGLDGAPRNHPQTHALVWRMNLVAQCLKRPDQMNSEPDVHVRDVISKATKHVDRIFRGTDGIAPGVVFTKDGLTYYPGQADVWRKWDTDMHLPEHARLQEHALERSAKIDPNRPDHRRVAMASFIAASVR